MLKRFVLFIGGVFALLLFVIGLAGVPAQFGDWLPFLNYGAEYLGVWWAICISATVFGCCCFFLGATFRGFFTPQPELTEYQWDVLLACGKPNPTQEHWATLGPTGECLIDGNVLRTRRGEIYDVQITFSQIDYLHLKEILNTVHYAGDQRSFMLTRLGCKMLSRH